MSIAKITYDEYPVYPGHPVTIALEIMLFYEGDISKAREPAVHPRVGNLGFPEALGQAEISGAGGCVYQALNLLVMVQDGEMSPHEAIAWGDDMWYNRTVKAGDHRHAFEEGQKQADRLKPKLLSRFASAICKGKL